MDCLLGFWGGRSGLKWTAFGWCFCVPQFQFLWHLTWVGSRSSCVASFTLFCGDCGASCANILLYRRWRSVGRAEDEAKDGAANGDGDGDGDGVVDVEGDGDGWCWPDCHLIVVFGLARICSCTWTEMRQLLLTTASESATAWQVSDWKIPCKCDATHL